MSSRTMVYTSGRNAARQSISLCSARLSIETLEDRCLPSVSGFRPIDEVGNSVSHPTQATAGTDLLRISPAAYADGFSSPSLPNNPGTRVLSDELNNQGDPANPTQDIQTVNQVNLSDFGYAFGQFMDHDMDLTPTTSGEFFNILADPNDPSRMATQTFERSTFDPATGTTNPRQQVNAVTSYLDLSQVYGSTQVVADALRTFQGGLLKTSDNGQLLPLDNTTYFTPTQIAALNMANASQLLPESELFAAGDVRANENMELTALQTLFVLNHNQLATELAKMNPASFGFTSWTDENLYQEARKLNIAEYQNIIYTQYLPDLLGPNYAPQYTGYNPNIDPAIATEFSTVAYRFGHSLLSNMIQRQDNNGDNINVVGGAPIDLANDFFDPAVINTTGALDPFGQAGTGIDVILKGDADGDAQAMDNLFVNEVRNLLFANGAAVDNGQDLVARDVQRARDDGIGTYNQVREAFGLAPVTSFAQITSNPQLQQELSNAYGGNVNNIDPFEGGVFENLAPGSSMGTLFSTILSNQFSRLENGDRYFYLNETFTPAEKALMNQGNTLAKIIEGNTDVTNLQADVFKFTASISGTVSLDLDNDGTPRTPGELGLAGFTVQLEDTSGDILATTTTNALGQYRFTQQSGPSANVEIAPGVSATGDYVVVLTLPSFLTQTAAPGTIHISRGGENITGQNFSVDFNFNGAPGVAFLSDGSGDLLAATTTDSSGNATFPGQTVTPSDTVVTLVLNPTTPSNPATLTTTHGSHTETVQFGADFTISNQFQAAVVDFELTEIADDLNSL